MDSKMLNTNLELLKALFRKRVNILAINNEEISKYKSNCIEIWFFELNTVIRKTIAPNFWRHFYFEPNKFKLNKKIYELNDGQYTTFHTFTLAVKQLESDYILLNNIITDLTCSTGDDIKIKINRIFRNALLGQKTHNLTQVVYEFYNISFKAFVCKYIPKISLLVKNTNNYDYYCLQECQCGYYINVGNDINKSLLYMGLLDRMVGRAITLLVQKKIKHYIYDVCHNTFGKSHLNELKMWLEDIILKWLTWIFNKGNLDIEENDSATKHTIQNFRVKLTYNLYEIYTRSLIEQFFNIIIDFPDSIPVLDDLKLCMEKIEIKKYLISCLKDSFEMRILHPGVNTMDILTGYIAAIKAIRYLDNTGIILETVTEPIKKYLRKRSDTVRRVVTGLTEEGPSELSEELARTDIYKENSINQNFDDCWETWLPNPLGFENYSNSFLKNTKRTADIISMVVDIYGSKELFMNEYRNLLADRLLSQLDFNAEKEIRNLELLKVRFGEALLHPCEVMLKDVTDSKRINAHIQGDTKYKDSKMFDISSLIISAQFWPTFNKESLEIPEEIKVEFEKYTTAYKAYKGNRTLNWRNVTGRVNVIIELNNRQMEFIVPPTQAVIIYYFQEKAEWSLEDLSNIMKVPATILRRRIGFWQAHGLIAEYVSGNYRLISDDEKEKCPYEPAELLKEEDLESAMASAVDQREEELQVFWSYIVGMLTNLDSLPLERIHQMLKLFATHGIGIEFTQEELKHFLQRKVREHKLFYSGGIYQLPK